MSQGQLAYITFVDPSGKPVDPGFGGGRPAGGGEHPDHGLPPGFGGGHPDQGLPSGGAHPGHPLPGQPGHISGQPVPRPKPPRTWPPQGDQSPNFPPDATDPDWGIDAGNNPSHPIYLPIGPDQGLPGDPAHPSQGLPPVEGGPKPPTDPPPGTIWPPLPPGAKPGKAALLFWLEGVGCRYVVVNLDAGADNTLPGQPGHVSGQPIPGQPHRPGHDLPQTPEPKR